MQSNPTLPPFSGTTNRYGASSYSNQQVTTNYSNPMAQHIHHVSQAILSSSVVTPLPVVNNSSFPPVVRVPANTNPPFLTVPVPNIGHGPTAHVYQVVSTTNNGSRTTDPRHRILFPAATTRN